MRRRSPDTSLEQTREAHFSKVVLFGALLAASMAANAETEAQRRTRIFKATKLLMVEDLIGPSAEYKDDGDPTTLEIVLYTKKADGPSRVSENGEVIFIRKGSVSHTSNLMIRAFEIRIARAESGT